MHENDWHWADTAVQLCSGFTSNATPLRKPVLSLRVAHSPRPPVVHARRHLKLPFHSLVYEYPHARRDVASEPEAEVPR